MHALIPSQHTMPLWRRTSSLLSSDFFSPSPLPSLHPGYAFGSFIASLLAADQPSKGLCKMEKAEVTPLSLLPALAAFLSYHQSERVKIQETATRQELREIY